MEHEEREVLNRLTQAALDNAKAEYHKRTAIEQALASATEVREARIAADAFYADRVANAYRLADALL